MADDANAARSAAAQLLALAVQAAYQRSRRGFSARTAAKEIGITASTLRRVEQGKPCSTDTAIKIFQWIGALP